MEAEKEVLRILKREGVELVATLPCEKIKGLLFLLERDADFKKIHLLKEEDGVGVCAGFALAGGRPALLIQSSGLGNAFNALLSLSAFYRLPLPVLASWRGVFKEKIEAQIPFNRPLPAVLSAFGIPHKEIHTADDLDALEDVVNIAFKDEMPAVALISPRVWEESSEGCECCEFSAPRREGWRKALMFECDVSPPEMTRFEAIKIIAEHLNAEVVVSNIGVPSKELFAARDRALNFYMLGSYSQASCIGFGISLRTSLPVFVLDGDGSLLATSILPVIAEHAPENLTIFCLDNGTFGSTGDQPTQAFSQVDMELLAKSFGFVQTEKVQNASQLKGVLKKIAEEPALRFVHVLLKPGNADVRNVGLDALAIKRRFRVALKQVEQRKEKGGRVC